MYSNNYSIFAPKKISDAWVGWLEQHGFTHLVTISFCPSRDFSCCCNNPWANQSVPSQTEFAKRYLKNVGQKVFRKGSCKGRRLHYIGFPELLTRRGDPTPFHFHVLVEVPTGYESRFDKYSVSEWRRALSEAPGLRNGAASLDIRPITDLPGGARYVTKFAHTELPFIDDLPQANIVRCHRRPN
jgi:hypothetical protein